MPGWEFKGIGNARVEIGWDGKCQGGNWLGWEMPGWEFIGIGNARVEIDRAEIDLG